MSNRKKLHLVSLGCTKNLVDSEVMLGRLKDYEITDDNTQADVIIVNTCGVIDAAKEESINTVLNLHDERKQNSILVMSGCLSERYREELQAEIDRKQKLKNDSQHLLDLRNWLENYLSKLMVNIEKHVMVSIYNEFNALIKEWFSLFSTNIDLSIDEDFSLKIFQAGYETDFNNLSGGEKTSVALAYRLALNKVIVDLISRIRTKDLLWAA